MTARDLHEKTITPAVIDRMKRAKSKRFKQVMGSLVTHLHQADNRQQGEEIPEPSNTQVRTPRSQVK